MKPNNQYPDIEFFSSKPAVPPRRSPVFRILLVLLLTAAAGVLCVTVWQEITASAAPIPAFAINFKSKGANSVLTKEWFLKHTGLSTNAMTLPEIEEKLKQAGQIKSVLKISRRLADVGIDVEVEERNPILQIEYSVANGKPETYLIDDEGVVYKGINYGNLFVAALPKLVNADPAVGENGEIRIPGMANVARLLACAKQHNADFHLSWEHISVSQFQEGRADFPGAYIRVRLRQKPQPSGMAKINDLIFSADIPKLEEQFAIYSSPVFRRHLVRELRSEPNRNYDLRLYLKNKNNPAGPLPEPRLTPSDDK
jgi:hypothetical protein